MCIFIPVSKVDEKLKAAEARRAELERAKAEEQQKKYTQAVALCFNTLDWRCEGTE